MTKTKLWGTQLFPLQIKAFGSYGPVYFNAYPNLQISLQDENSLSSLMLNVSLNKISEKYARKPFQRMILLMALVWSSDQALGLLLIGLILPLSIL